MIIREESVSSAAPLLIQIVIDIGKFILMNRHMFLIL